ncbi:cytochrome c oxidase subunit 3 [Zavarzinia compransoris]|uniref:Cytochrome C oxidase subunit III n=1 Tax=Zavarzinia compransoris TaxID=1264899 RepID=A0A317E1V7_9PROT|nr:cytochrome c oxidase subunit 3 [Zavarzinia compransoris]PWR20949.1 cytochrome C oxidase subunit III [Zavarzinia compransoris]TDP43977.1 nitric oxide reductase NorE protein [Zavarzinia compransoris]
MTAGARRVHVPGEGGVWLFIAGDMVLFSVLFFTFLSYRAGSPQAFAAGRAHLDQVLGLVNTLLLLTSSWFVATGVKAARQRAAGVPQACFAAALGCGLGFGAVKVFEYRAKFDAGLALADSDFFMFYFAYTGIHMIHVVIGMGILLLLINYVRSRPIEAVNLQHVESGATFWHLVDVLWIVIFALLYLLV